MPEKRVLVVGTTLDYIEYISKHYPGRAMFLISADERKKGFEPLLLPNEEIVCGVEDSALVIKKLMSHLEKWEIIIAGIACYDCESLELACNIALKLNLPFPGHGAVTAARNKYFARKLWKQAGILCPDSALADTAEDIYRFIDKIDKPLIVKPLTGSGSELVFKCRDYKECSTAYKLIRSGLAARTGNAMYRIGEGAHILDPLRFFMVEEFISGTEYSCDFIINNEDISIIRTAEKIPAPGQLTGTTLAYVVPEALPEQIDSQRFAAQLKSAAMAQGLTSAVCMADFIVSGNAAYLLEISPRPGGDCLPQLILKSMGLDIIGLVLDFAENSQIKPAPGHDYEKMAGLRLLSGKTGIVKNINCARILQDTRVVECGLRREKGHRVKLPPDDYDSRILGHVIFKPFVHCDIESQCLDIASKLELEIESENESSNICNYEKSGKIPELSASAS